MEFELFHQSNTVLGDRENIELVTLLAAHVLRLLVVHQHPLEDDGHVRQPLIELVRHVLPSDPVRLSVDELLDENPGKSTGFGDPVQFGLLPASVPYQAGRAEAPIVGVDLQR